MVLGSAAAARFVPATLNTSNAAAITDVNFFILTPPLFAYIIEAKYVLIVLFYV